MRAVIVDAAYRVFYKEGFGRARLDVIAEAAGVSKRTLYYHFDSKDELLAAVLEAQHELVFASVRGWADGPDVAPEDLVRRLFDKYGAWSRQPGWQGSGFTRSVMELADLPGHPARAVARRHKTAIEDWLTHQLTGYGAMRPEQVARQIMLLIEGCHSLILIHGDSDYAEAASDAAVLLVRQTCLRKDGAQTPPAR